MKNGIITISNHVFDEDYVAIRNALAPRTGYTLVWKNNHLRRLGAMIRIAGSIPIPTNDSSATLSMMHAVDKCLQDGKWLHIYPEASMFYFYQDIRPFVDGAFVFAVRNNKPIFPLVFSYRPAKGLYKIWKKKGSPLINLSFGEPIYPNPDLSMREAISDLNKRCHAEVKKLMMDNTPEVK
ncbi:MAG TPA: 1-acyl-sn-glycerol-3-phosphate acyltransferase [Erysipelotrichaceae bacterium]|nr:1-acyl-sn-glycerol-3-phosphate acyltransferase [Erysipelotrichaceae bacterium]